MKDWTTARMKHFTALIACIGTTVALLAIGAFVFYRVPLVPFVPVCKEVRIDKGGGYYQLQRIEGPYSDEYFRAVLAYMRKPWIVDSNEIIGIEHGQFLVPLAADLSYDRHWLEMARFDANSPGTVRGMFEELHGLLCRPTA